MVVVLILLAVAVAFAVGGFIGAPYVPILSRDSEALLKLSELKPGQTMIDLGSGDGRLLRLAAKRGIRCIGYEINPILVVVSRLVCWRYRRLVTIHNADLWRVKLPPADVIYVFLMPRFMARFDAFIKQQVTQPTKLISYVFAIPKRTPAATGANAYVYHYEPLK